MGRYTYSLQAHLGEQWRTFWDHCSRGEGRGYLEAKKGSPGPRLAYRLVRSDGEVVEEIPAEEDVTIGMSPGGSPTPEQYAWAALRALQGSPGSARRGVHRHRRPGLGEGLEPLAEQLRALLEGR